MEKLPQAKDTSGVSVWMTLYNVWWGIKRAFALVLALSLAWSFFDLAGPPVIKEMIAESFPFNLFIKKENPPSKEERVLTQQKTCPHAVGYNFCPLCGKRLYPWEGGAGGFGRWD